MHRRVSINKSIKNPLDSKRINDIKHSIPNVRQASSDVFGQVLQETQLRLAIETDPDTSARLTQRLNDIEAAIQFFNAHSDIEFLGVYGWGESCQVKCNAGEGISQFDSIIYRKEGKLFVEKIGSCWQIMSSKSAQKTLALPQKNTGTITTGGEIHTIPKKIVKPQMSFPVGTAYCMTAETLAVQLSQFPPAPRCRNSECIDPDCGPILANDNSIDRPTNPLIATRRKKVPKQPSCTDPNCSDLNCLPQDDTPATDNRSESRLTINLSEGCPCCLNAVDLDELAGIGKSINTSDGATGNEFELPSVDSHWGLTAGLVGPFAAIGLVAAYRNVTGAYDTRHKLMTKLSEINALIQQDPTPQRQAYRTCLEYSLFDATWNIAVPGVLNGTSSSAGLSTLVVASPVAIPAIGAYSLAQTGRGIYDTIRTWNRITGHEKIDQITRSKRYFYVSNTSAFGIMCAGAVLVAVSPATFGATLIPGLCLLIPGTISSGVLNNIWPRKFRPRNGDIGIARDQLTTAQCATMIQTIREEKHKIKQFKMQHLKSSKSIKTQRVLAKLTAALPFCQANSARWLHRLTQEELNRSKTALTIHQNELMDSLSLGDTPTDITKVITTHLKWLRYRQYALNDFYWALNQVPISNPSDER